MGFFAHYEKHSDPVHRQVQSTGVLFLHHTDGICTVTLCGTALNHEKLQQLVPGFTTEELQ
jgi:hypothetical protein